MAQKKVRVKVGQRWYTVEVHDTTTSMGEVVVDGETFLVETDGSRPMKAPPQPSSTTPAPREDSAPPPASPPASDDKVLRSPMPGKVLSVAVEPGDNVSSGDEVCVVEAMKMHQSIRVSQEGRIAKVHIQIGDQVNTGDLLIELE